jgi:CHAT domain-containing protein
MKMPRLDTAAWAAWLAVLAAPCLAAPPGCEPLGDTPPADAFAADCLRAPGRNRALLVQSLERLDGWLAADPDAGWVLAARAGLLVEELRPGAEAAVRAALDAFAAGPDLTGEAYVRTILARLHWAHTRKEEARAELERARELERQQPDPTTYVRIAAGQASMEERDHQSAETVALAREVLRQPAFERAAAPSRHALMHFFVLALARVGRYSEALHNLTLLTEACGEDPQCPVHTATTTGYVVHEMGNAGVVSREEVAAARLREFETAERHGSSFLALGALCYMAPWFPPDEAETWDRRCVEQAESMNCGFLAVAAALRLAEAELRRDPARVPEALRAAEHALDVARTTRSIDEMVNAWLKLAKLQHLGGDDGASIRSLEQVLDLVEVDWGRTADPDGGPDVTASRRGHYDQLGWLQAFGAHGDPEGVERSFETMERLRARSYATSLARSGVEPSADDELAGIREEIVRAQRRLGRAAGDEHSALLTRLDALEAQEAALLRERARASASREELEHPRAASVREIQAVLAEDEALLQFNLPARTHPWVTSVTGSGVESVELDVPELARIQHLYSGLVARRDDAEGSAGRALARALFSRPLARLPAAVRRLVIVADGSMFGLPLAGLPDPRGGQPLAASYELALAASATSWLRLRESSRPGLEPAILGFADPLFPAGAAREATLRSWTLPAALAPLPRSREEVSDVVALFGGASRALVGPEASEAALKGTDLGPFGMVHFATHAFSNRSSPARSAVMLAPGGPSEDGLLQPREIAALELGGRIVVLSACDSAEGPLAHGDGPLSLARAFLRAGAAAVVGTQWPVRDDEAAALMRRFYRNLARGSSVGAALSQAQAAAAREGVPAAAWAGFVLIGDGATRFASAANVEEMDSSRRIGVVVVGALAATAFLGLGIFVARRGRAVHPRTLVAAAALAGALGSSTAGRAFLLDVDVPLPEGGTPGCYRNTATETGIPEEPEQAESASGPHGQEVRGSR